MITCVGPIFLDRVVKIDRFPEKPIKMVANGLEKRLGGPSPVASFAIKSLEDCFSQFAQDAGLTAAPSTLSSYSQSMGYHFKVHPARCEDSAY